MHDELFTSLEEVCGFLADDLQESVEKIKKSGKMSSGDVEYIDKLTHSIKSVKTTLAMLDSGYSSDGMSAGMSGARRRSRTTGRFYSGDSYGSGNSGEGGSGNGASSRSYGSSGDGQQMAQQLRRMADMMEQNC